MPIMNAAANIETILTFFFIFESSLLEREVKFRSSYIIENGRFSSSFSLPDRNLFHGAVIGTGYRRAVGRRQLKPDRMLPARKSTDIIRLPFYDVGHRRAVDPDFHFIAVRVERCVRNIEIEQHARILRSGVG